MVSCPEEFPPGPVGGWSLYQAWALSESFTSPGPLFPSPGARRALGQLGCGPEVGSVCLRSQSGEVRWSHSRAIQVNYRVASSTDTHSVKKTCNACVAAWAGPPGGV